MKIFLLLLLIACASVSFGQNKANSNVANAESAAEQTQAPTNSNQNTVAETVQQPPETPNADAKRQQEQSDAAYWAQSSAKATWVQAIAGIVVLLFIAWQAYQAHQTGKENQRLINQNARLIRANKRQADSLNDQQETMVEALKRTDTLLGQNERIINAMNTQSLNAIAQTGVLKNQEARMIEQRDVMLQTLKHLRAMERPMVIIKEVECIPEVAPLAVLIPQFTVINEGRSVATHVWLSCVFKVTDVPIYEYPDDMPNKLQHIHILTNATPVKRMMNAPLTLTQTQYDSLCAGNSLLTMYGTGTYTDAAASYQMDPYLFYWLPQENRFRSDTDAPFMYYWKQKHAAKQANKKAQNPSQPRPAKGE